MVRVILGRYPDLLVDTLLGVASGLAEAMGLPGVVDEVDTTGRGLPAPAASRPLAKFSLRRGRVVAWDDVAAARGDVVVLGDWPTYLRLAPRLGVEDWERIVFFHSSLTDMLPAHGRDDHRLLAFRPICRVVTSDTTAFGADSAKNQTGHHVSLGLSCDPLSSLRRRPEPPAVSSVAWYDESPPPVAWAEGRVRHVPADAPATVVVKEVRRADGLAVAPTMPHAACAVLHAVAAEAAVAVLRGDNAGETAADVLEDLCPAAPAPRVVNAIGAFAALRADGGASVRSERRRGLETVVTGRARAAARSLGRAMHRPVTEVAL